ncbi:MAG: GGDEF domain-containing protein [Rhizobiaceae bacterium]
MDIGTRTGRIMRDAARLIVPILPAAVLVSHGLGYGLLAVGGLDAFTTGVMLAIVLPLMLVTPLVVWVAVERERRRAAHRTLVVASMRDRATGFIDGTALAGLVEDRRARRAEGSAGGAFLIVDAGALDTINRRYGFAWRDEALAQVADAIRSSVRTGDVVARIATDRFGVLLPGADADHAQDVGERIRAAVAARYFAPEGVENMLSVAVGGVATDAEASLTDLYAIAAETLDDPAARAATTIRAVAAMPAR